MRKLIQRLSIWLFRKSFNLPRVNAPGLTNIKTQNQKGEKNYGTFLLMKQIIMEVKAEEDFS